MKADIPFQKIDDTRYKVIPRVLLFIFNADQVLLIKGSDTKKTWPGLYNGLGGHVEKGESVLEAAKRELEEESGITALIMDCVGNILIDGEGDVGICVFVFYGETAQKNLSPSCEGTPEWIPLANIGKIQCVADLPMLIPKVIEAHQSGSHFSEVYSRGNRICV